MVRPGVAVTRCPGVTSLGEGTPVAEQHLVEAGRVGRALVLVLVVIAGRTADAAAPPRLQPSVGPSKMFVVYKPADWKLTEQARADSFTIAVESPARTSRVDFRWDRNPGGRPDAVAALGVWRRALLQANPGASLSETFVAKDSSRAVTTVSYRSTAGAMRGRYFFESTPTGNSLQGYVALASQLGAERPLLLNVMSSLAFVKVLHRGGGVEAPIEVSLVDRRAPDGSLTMKAPASWDFLAARGRVITGAPGGSDGFIFTAFAGNPMLPGATVAQGVIGTPWRQPAQALVHVLAGFGHRHPVVLSTTVDRATMAECPSQAGTQCEAADITAKWTTASGVNCLGAFKVVNTLPGITGQWSSIVAGIWGPEKDLHRHYPMLVEVASSYAVNDRYAQAYIQAGLANLRRLQEQTAAAVRGLHQAREDNQVAWEARQERKDYMDSKWDDYRRGQSYWVSDLEGGKVYETDNSGTRDTVTGDYYEGRPFNWTNFEGENPRHPGETMRELSSYEIEHKGSPPR